MKNIKIIALLVMTLVVVLACFTSCETLQQIPGINQIPGIKPEEPVHEHSYENGKCECGELEPGYSCLNHTWGEEITLGAEPTCTEDGYNLVTCTVCGYQRKTPIFRLGHNYTDEQTFVVVGTCTAPGAITKICTRCSESDVTETPMHPNTDIAYGYAPTCLDDGMYTRMECPDCGKMWGDQACTQEVTLEQVTIPATGHQNIVHNEAVEANCHQNGNIEHWICMDCGFAWLDEACTLNTNVLSVILPHTAEIVNVAATEANCHQDGNIAYSYCSECFYAWTVDEEGNKMTTTFKDVVILHTAEIINVDAVEANCHQNGNVAYSYCAECSYAWTVDEEGNKMTTNAQSVVIPATVGLRYVEATQANCHQNGYDAHYVCDECEARFLDAAGTQLTNIRNLTNSNATADIVYVPAAPACHANGNVEYWYCSECDAVFTDEALTQLSNRMNVVVPATLTLTHVEAVDPTCTENGHQEYWYCESCEGVYSDADGRYLTNRMNLVLVATGVHADNDGDFKCDDCSTAMLPEAGSTLTVAQAIAVAKVAGTSYTTGKYYITGTFTGCYNTTYGNFYLEDAEGNQLLIYGLYIEDNGEDGLRYDKMNPQPVEGDTVTVYTVLGIYSGKTQGKNAWLTDLVAHEHTGNAATCTTPSVCTICGNTIAPAAGHNYVDGTCTGCGASENAAKTYSNTFTKSVFSANGTKDLNGVNWTLAGDGGYWGWDSNNGKGHQFGSSGNPYKTMTLTSADFTNVSEIVIKTSGASSVAATLTVMVGDTVVGTVNITSSATVYTFTCEEPLDGPVVFSYTQTSSKALYINSIEITYQ